MTLVGDKSLASTFHNFERFRGLGGQGAELGMLRRCDLRGWDMKMHPAVSDGEMVLASYLHCPELHVVPPWQVIRQPPQFLEFVRTFVSHPFKKTPSQSPHP